MRTKSKQLFNMARQHTAAWRAFEAATLSLYQDEGIKPYALEASGGEVLRFNSAAEAQEYSARHFHNAARVRHEAFLAIKERVDELRRDELYAMQDLISRGLTFSEDVSKTIIGYESPSDMSPAQREVNPRDTDNDAILYEEKYTLSWVTHKGFSLPWRGGRAFDLTRSLSVGTALRKVMELCEQSVVLGASEMQHSFNGETITHYGYLTHPQRGTNSGSIPDFTNIANIGQFHSIVLAELSNMYAQQKIPRTPNSINLYVSQKVYGNLQEDYKAESSLTALQRTLNIEEIAAVRPLPDMPDNEMCLVRMSADSVELCIQRDITAVPHTPSQVFDDNKWTAYGMIVPIIKVDALGRTGIRHIS